MLRVKLMIGHCVMIASRCRTTQTKQVNHACSLSWLAPRCRLYYQDSRGLAAMLKELSKSGHGQQALELFDCLQNLPPDHDLAPLADVFSYTTGSPCILQLKQGLHCSAQGFIVSILFCASSFSTHDWLHHTWSCDIHQDLLASCNTGCIVTTVHIELEQGGSLAVLAHTLALLTYACIATLKLL